MTHPSVEHSAVAVLLAYWLRTLDDTAPAAPPDVPALSDAAAIASYTVGLLYDNEHSEAALAFECGFSLAVATSAAVVFDPLGDPRAALKAACDEARQTIALTLSTLA